MAVPYKGTLVIDPMTGKPTYEMPSGYNPAMQGGAGYLLPQQEQQIVRGSTGLPTKLTTSPVPIHQQPALKMHPMTTPEAVGFPAATTGSESTGAVPTGIAGYFGAANKQGKIQLDPHSGVATGGFAMKEENRLAEVARQQADQDLFWESTARAKNNELMDKQLSMMGFANRAANSGDLKKIAALAQLQSAMASVRPYDYGHQNLAQAQAKQAGSPLARTKMQEEIKKLQAETGLVGAQTEALPRMNAVKAATALMEAKSKMSENDAKILDATIKSGDANAIMALGVYPQFKQYVAAYMAAQQAAKG